MRGRAAGPGPGLWRLALAAALGGAMALGQAPFGLWVVALAALAGLVALVARQGRGSGWIGFWAGAGYFAAALSWVVEPFLVEAEVYGWMAPFALLFLSAGLALFWGLAAWVGPWLGRPLVHFGRRRGDTAGRGLGFAVALVAVEMLRGHVLTGFPWALIGHVWIGHPPAQLAALAGPAGLTLMTALAAWAFAQGRLVPLAGGVLVVGAAFAFGLWRLALPEPAAPGALVRLVQPNADQALKWDPVQADVFFRRLLDFTRAAPAEAGAVARAGVARPDLVIWPETAVPYLLEDYPEVAVQIAAAGAGVPVATGVQRVEGWRFWNSLAVIGAGGAVTARYDKHHLVPFGEYIPFGDLAYRWFGLTAFAAQEGNGYSAGSGPAVIDLGSTLGKALPIICYEAVFPQDLRAAPERAAWIL
ncbi:MAG: apolipoprotein N-acyltransferase, partial [Pseudomonadota bacterium]